ncbi:MAG: hypothetical protein CH6_2869 [Candidatus Kapaibacterium sp.]|jgi:anti-sigma regulatory factor (Ser/Thr protein kinase)|nr:MAG: hypothetical protein CH6_2869 [Candidatus Kapabacteria bacterium]ROL56985.1 MAG: ATP-binding protein [Bacteroidetes/Chlorobi group bacterium Naka2016]
MSGKYKLVLKADLNELDKLRDFVKNICYENNIDEGNLFKISLALEEACVNLIKHSYKFDSSKQISIYSKVEKGKIHFTLEDYGASFDPREVLPIEIEQIRKKYQKGGMGIFLISQIMDEINYTPKNKNSPSNKLELTKILE